MKLPKNLAQCADLLYTTRAARLSLEKEVDEYRKQEQALRDHIIEQLPKSEATGIKGKVASVNILRKVRGSVTDWDALYSYIHKHKAYELLQRRVGEKALQERWDDGKQVPGVEPFHYLDVSCTKL